MLCVERNRTELQDLTCCLCLKAAETCTAQTLSLFGLFLADLKWSIPTMRDAEHIDQHTKPHLLVLSSLGFFNKSQSPFCLCWDANNCPELGVRFCTANSTWEKAHISYLTHFCFVYSKHCPPAKINQNNGVKCPPARVVTNTNYLEKRADKEFAADRALNWTHTSYSGEGEWVRIDREGFVWPCIKIKLNQL